MLNTLTMESERMGTKERRERERMALKQRILGAALDIATAEGWPAVTVRKVADRIEYTAPALYAHFESKDGILQELVREGFGKLLALLRTAYGAAPDPTERMVGLALAYCDFAWDNRELYQVMHGLGGAACHLPGPPEDARLIVALLHEAVTAALAPACAAARDLDRELDIHRATLYGLVALAMDGRLPGGRARCAALVAQSTRDWLAGARMRFAN
jgi:AcrR family transcriptional regulator